MEREGDQKKPRLAAFISCEGEGKTWQTWQQGRERSDVFLMRINSYWDINMKYEIFLT
jgi:hypothetical protein